MPAKSAKQYRFMGLLKGNPEKRLQVGMSEKQVDEFIKTTPKSLRKGKKHGKK